MARIIISLPVELLQELDAYATERKYNRSECIRHAIRMMVHKEDNYVVEKPVSEETHN